MVLNPNYRKTVLDSVSDAISPILRKITDCNIKFFGTQTQILRITQKVYNRKLNELQNVSVLGDYDNNLEAIIYHSCQISYPFNDMEIFMSRGITDNGFETAEMNINGIDVTDILPITAQFLFEGNYLEDPIELKEKDIIVDVLFDSGNNAIPIIMQIMRLRGSFFGKNQIKKTCELSVFRDNLTTELESPIEDYIKYIQDVRREEILIKR